MDLLSPIHLIIVLAIALLVFGPRRLPEIGSGLGKTIRAFKGALEGEPQKELPTPPPEKTE
jgi:sec-independent protein translocase protein TatA